MPMTTDRMQRLFDDLRKAAEQADCFDEVALREGLLACRARGASADAWYQVASTDDRLVVRLVTPDRWLSESIEADLMHHGDPLEELIEEELVELGHDPRRDGELGPVRHFRSEERLYTFENEIPLGDALARGDDEAAAAIARRWLLAYEAAFRELGDMSGDDGD